jgi:hypothetical protein
LQENRPQAPRFRQIRAPEFLRSSLPLRRFGIFHGRLRHAAEDVARKGTAEAEKAAQEVTLEAERKTARDARYAARKTRRR